MYRVSPRDEAHRLGDSNLMTRNRADPTSSCLKVQLTFTKCAKLYAAGCAILSAIGRLLPWPKPANWRLYWYRTWSDTAGLLAPTKIGHWRGSGRCGAI